MSFNLFGRNAAISALFIALFLVASPARAAGNRGPVVFDLTHNEIFSPLVEDKLHYSDFYDSIKKTGIKCDVNRKSVTEQALRGVGTYVVAGPASLFREPEIKALEDFVKKGGNLLVLLHISSPVARLTQTFGILVSNFVISEKVNTISGRSQDFYVTRLSDHPVTRGVKRIAVYGTWGLKALDGASVVARTSDGAWADVNRDRRYEKGEPVQSFGIVAVSEYGKGKVVVVADDAPFANLFFSVADNRLLAANIIRWFTGK